MIFVNKVPLPIAQVQGVLSRSSSTPFLPSPHILNSENGIPTTIPMGTNGHIGKRCRAIQAENVKQRCLMIQMALCLWMANGQEVKADKVMSFADMKGRKKKWVITSN